MSAGRILAINEWLFADLACSPESQQWRQAAAFIETMLDRPDKIVIPAGSPWANKAYKFSKNAHLRNANSGVASVLFGSIVYNSSKAIMITPEEASQCDIQNEHLIPEEDRYLVRAALMAKADVIVTTDQKLLEGIQQSGISMEAVHRDQFLESYISAELKQRKEERAPDG